jgi:hypothetical protein
MSTSTRIGHLNLIVMSTLSHIVGVSFKQVLANFVHVTVRYSIQNKVVWQSRIGILPGLLLILKCICMLCV